MPKIPNFKALIQELDTRFKSSTRPRDVAPTSPIIEINFVKKTVEAYEMKHENTMCLLNNRQADARVASVSNVRGEQLKDKHDSNFSKTIKMPGKVKSTLGDSSPVDEREPSNDEEKMKEITKMFSSCVKINDDDADEKDNVRTDVSSTSKISIDPSTRDSACNAKDAYVMYNSFPPKDSQVTVSDKCRKLFGKIKRCDCKTVHRRSWPKYQKDESWHMKRKGGIFFTSHINNEHLAKCEVENGMTRWNNLENIAIDNSQDYDNDNILAILDTLDDSGNSYKNLQIDMFDFENEELHHETRKTNVEFVSNQQATDEMHDDMEIIDLNRSSLEFSNEVSMSDILLMNETLATLFSSEDEVDMSESTYNAEPVGGSSWTTDKESAKIVDAENSKQPIKTTRMTRILRKKLPCKGILKKLLYIFKPKQYFEETSEDDVNMREQNDQQLQTSQQSHHLLSPESIFIEQN